MEKLNEEQINKITEYIVSSVIDEQYSSFKEILDGTEVQQYFTPEQFNKLDDFTLSISQSSEYDEDEEEETEGDWEISRDYPGRDTSWDCSSNDLEEELTKEVKDVFQEMTRED